MVDDDGFRDLIQRMDPKYKMPSRTYFKDIMLPKLYNELRKDLEYELEGVQVCSNYRSITYIVTCHFVNKKFKLVSTA